MVENGYLALNNHRVDSVGYARSAGPADDAITQCTENQGVTIAAWLTFTPQEGVADYPRRIFSIEDIDANNDFVLGQGTNSTDQDKLVLRVGQSPELVLIPSVWPASQEPTWVFIAMGPNGRFTYQIGDMPQMADYGNDGTVWDWTPGYVLTLGNSNSMVNQYLRPWKGRIHHLEFYCRVLGEQERQALKASTDPRGT